MNRRRSHKQEIADVQHKEAHSAAQSKWELWKEALKDRKHTNQHSAIIHMTRIPPALLALLVMHYLILQVRYPVPLPATKMPA